MNALLFYLWTILILVTVHKELSAFLCPVGVKYCIGRCKLYSACAQVSYDASGLKCQFTEKREPLTLKNRTDGANTVIIVTALATSTSVQKHCPNKRRSLVTRRGKHVCVPVVGRDGKRVRGTKSNDQCEEGFLSISPGTMLRLINYYSFKSRTWYMLITQIASNINALKARGVYVFWCQTSPVQCVKYTIDISSMTGKSSKSVKVSGRGLAVDLKAGNVFVTINATEIVVYSTNKRDPWTHKSAFTTACSHVQLTEASERLRKLFVSCKYKTDVYVYDYGGKMHNSIQFKLQPIFITVAPRGPACYALHRDDTLSIAGRPILDPLDIEMVKLPGNGSIRVLAYSDKLVIFHEDRSVSAVDTSGQPIPWSTPVFSARKLDTTAPVAFALFPSKTSSRKTSSRKTSSTRRQTRSIKGSANTRDKRGSPKKVVTIRYENISAKFSSVFVSLDVITGQWSDIARVQGYVNFLHLSSSSFYRCQERNDGVFRTRVVDFKWDSGSDKMISNGTCVGISVDDDMGAMFVVRISGVWKVLKRRWKRIKVNTKTTPQMITIDRNTHTLYIFATTLAEVHGHTYNGLLKFRLTTHAHTHDLVFCHSRGKMLYFDARSSGTLRIIGIRYKMKTIMFPTITETKNCTGFIIRNIAVTENRIVLVSKRNVLAIYSMDTFKRLSVIQLKQTEPVSFFSY